MNYAIVYSSRTGNTAQLANASKDMLPKEDCEYAGEIKEEEILAPLLYIGFWTDKGRCDEATITFLKTLKNKKVFLFGTAGFGGESVYFDKIMTATKGYSDESNEVIASFMCQGKMPNSVLNRYEKMLVNSANPNQIQSMIDNFHKAEVHPNVSDFEAFKLTISNIV